LLDRHHRQLATLGAQRVALTGQLLLLDQQALAGGGPFVSRYNRWFRHGLSGSRLGEVVGSRGAACCAPPSLRSPYIVTSPLHRHIAPTSSHSPYIVTIDGVMPGTNPGAAMMRIPSATIARASGTSMAALAGSSFCANTRAAMTSIQ